MKSILIFSFVLVLLVCTQGCSQYTYFPQVPQTPATAPKELDAACTELFSFTGWQVSYSPVNKLNFGLAADYGTRLPHAGFEAGAGYYNDLGSHMKYGVYGGYGTTEFHLHKDCDSHNGDCYEYFYGKDPVETRLRNSDQLYEKIFFQPYVIFYNANVSCNIGFKSLFLHYPDFFVTDEYTQYPPLTEDTILFTETYQQLNGRAVSFQPYLSLYAGDELWQGVFSISYQFIPYTNIAPSYFSAPVIDISIGINRKFSLRKKRAHGTPLAD